MTMDQDATGEMRPGRRGRPALDAETRAARIFDAVETVISEVGLQGVSMNAIARAAGMSKRTLYGLYDGRDHLFEAWVRHARASVVRPLPPQAHGLPLAERLRLLLRLEGQHCLSGRRLAVLRSMVAEAPRYPELARAFVREGWRAARGIVAEELTRAAAAGEIRVDDPWQAAMILLDMAYQDPLDPLIDPDITPDDSAAADARLDRAIRIFLGGTRAADAAP
ncbi:TetR/AcrR family transcriptional regulator [Roseospira goensis]|uniref:AcrR family transcriptional regulator n=1 Tax=Roseospira goensis TaxID=391922 RepID=A0A7W6RXP9_9PROT|nr:TetR/AcrR family transcriptional regulator [Roseospira goensis]MBB4284487.1 AcrR family transcriptional regulator [Roseospira goensis]